MYTQKEQLIINQAVNTIEEYKNDWTPKGKGQTFHALYKLSSSVKSEEDFSDIIGRMREHDSDMYHSLKVAYQDSFQERDFDPNHAYQKLSEVTGQPVEDTRKGGKGLALGAVTMGAAIALSGCTDFLNRDEDQDSDGDGIMDKVEWEVGSDPHNPYSTPDDIDGDGLSNDFERSIGTDPKSEDTDEDNLGDGLEYHSPDRVYQGLKLDPLHKDIVIKEFLVGDSEMPPKSEKDHLIDFYRDGFSLSNPNGKSGVNLHFINGGVVGNVNERPDADNSRPFVRAYYDENGRLGGSVASSNYFYVKSDIDPIKDVINHELAHMIFPVIPDKYRDKECSSEIMHHTNMEDDVLYGCTTDGTVYKTNPTMVGWKENSGDKLFPKSGITNLHNV